MDQKHCSDSTIMTDDLKRRIQIYKNIPKHGYCMQQGTEVN
jgi:hypothetical protein